MKHDLKVLEDALLFWEDWNTAVEIRCLNYLLARDIVPSSEVIPEGFSDYKAALHGSEVNDNNLLAKPIPEYKTLRTLLESKDTKPLQEKNLEDFFPRIPQGLESTYQNRRFEFASQKLSSAHQIPFYLGKWAVAKKVCFINRPELVPLIFPITEMGVNYLDRLPYDDFLLELGTPIVYKNTIAERSFQVKFKHILIHREDDVIGIFMIPNEINEHCFSETDVVGAERMAKHLAMGRQIMRSGKMNPKAIRKMTKIFKELYTIENDEIELGLSDFNFSQLLFTSNYFGIKEEDYNTLGVNAINLGKDTSLGVELLNHAISLLNGFCKVVADARENIAPLSIMEVTLDTDQENMEEKTPTASTTAPPEIENYEWYEVPENSVDFLKMKRHKGETRAVYVQGTGKSPHPRMRHPRRYRNPDGTIRKEVWVKASFIHKEKLKAGAQSKAGVLKI